MARNGLLIDYTYCSGCHTCILACQQEKGYNVGQDGITLHQIGPRIIPGSDNASDKWEYDYVPVPTELCDLCAERTAKGKKPACVHHCQALCMEYGDVEDLAKIMANGGKKYVLFSK